MATPVFPPAKKVDRKIVKKPTRCKKHTMTLIHFGLFALIPSTHENTVHP